MRTRVHRTTREEMETTFTFNRHEGVAECCTADPAVMRRWTRAGWRLEVLGRYADGTPRTWQTAVPWRLAVKFGRPRAAGTAGDGDAPSASGTPRGERIGGAEA